MGTEIELRTIGNGAVENTNEKSRCLNIVTKQNQKTITHQNNQTISKSADSRSASTQVDIDDFIAQINNGSYKKEYLTFWERLYAFFEHIFAGNDRDLSLEYLVGKIDKKCEIDFATSLIEKISETEDPNKKKILEKILVLIINDISDSEKSSLAKSIFEKLSQMEDSAEKKTLGEMFCFTISKINDDLRRDSVRNLIEPFLLEDDQEKIKTLTSTLGYIGGNCCDTHSSISIKLSTYLSILQRAYVGSRYSKYFAEIIPSALAYRINEIKQGIDDLNKNQKPSDDFLNLLNDLSLYSFIPESIALNDVNGEFIFDILSTKIDLFVSNTILPKKDFINNEIDTLKRNNDPSNQFLKLINEIPQKYYTKIQEKTGLDLNYASNEILNRLIFGECNDEINTLNFVKQRFGIGENVEFFFETQRDFSPIVQRNAWNQLVTNFEKCVNDTIERFINEIRPDGTSEDKITQWGKIKEKWESYQDKPNFDQRSTILSKIYKEGLNKEPWKTVFNKILRFMQSENIDLFEGIGYDLNKGSQELSDLRFNIIANRLKEVCLFSQALPGAQSLGGDEMADFVAVIQDAYIQKKQQEELWHEVPGYDRDITESFNQTAASES